MPKILSTRTIRLCSASVLPLACVLSMPAAAQGVTLYGSVDAAVIVSNSGAPGASNAMGVTSGVLTPSRWGLRGSEALGGGTNAVFVLEAGLDTDTGAAKAYAGNPATATPTAPNGVSGTGFNRRSFVGLESRFGTLTIGRDYTPFYYTGLQTDPMGLTLFGNVQAITPLVGGSERWGRISNALFYTSPVVGGFKGRAAYSFGSESGGGAAGSLPKQANVFLGVGGDYVNGGLVVSGSYQKLNYPEVAGATPAFTGGVGKRTDASLGAKYTFGQFSVAGGYWTLDRPQAASDVWLGGTWTMGAFKLMTVVQRLFQDDPAGGSKLAATSLGLGGVYDFSKRTALYASYGQVSNGPKSAFHLLSADTIVTAGARGADPKAFAVGIRHNF